MGLLANPWLILIAVVAFGAIVGGASWKAYGMGKDAVYAEQAKAEAIRKETRDIAIAAAGEQIAKIQIRHTTINRKAESVLREKVIYTECSNDPDVQRLLDDARRGAKSPADDSGSVP